MNKRLVALCVGFALIAVILILNGTVFAVDSVEVVFDRPADAETEKEMSDKLIKASGLTDGKSVFTISESTMIRNIKSKVPDVNIIGIERVFPNKVVIYALRRVAVLAIPFKPAQQNKCSYAVLDGDMVVLGISNDVPVGVAKVEGFELRGNYGITVGDTLNVEFGDEVYYLQNVAASFVCAGLSPEEFAGFISEIVFDDDKISVVTGSGVRFVFENYKDKNTEIIRSHVIKAYEWYKKFDETAEEIKGGYAIYNPLIEDFVWNEE